MIGPDPSHDQISVRIRLRKLLEHLIKLLQIATAAPKKANPNNVAVPTLPDQSIVIWGRLTI